MAAEVRGIPAQSPDNPVQIADLGFQENEYNRDFRAGTQEVDILNVPANYLTSGDYVASSGFIWNDPTEIAEITIDLVVER